MAVSGVITSACWLARKRSSYHCSPSRMPLPASNFAFCEIFACSNSTWPKPAEVVNAGPQACSPQDNTPKPIKGFNARKCQPDKAKRMANQAASAPIPYTPIQGAHTDNTPSTCAYPPAPQGKPVSQRPRMSSAKVHKAANNTLAVPGRAPKLPLAKATQTAQARA